MTTQKTKELKSAKQVVYEMLTESTGSHILDSGGAYGRHWENNQKKSLQDFENEPAVELEFNDDGTLDYWSISVFHYLVGQSDPAYDLDTNEICEEFNRINLNADNWDSDRFYGVSQEADDFLDSLDDVEIEYTVNTYNGESALSQILQYTTLNIDGDAYVILQIHQGCDARGGYTDARLFTLPDGYMPREWFSCEAANSENVFTDFDFTESEVFDIEGTALLLSDVHKPNEDTLINNEHQQMNLC